MKVLQFGVAPEYGRAQTGSLPVCVRRVVENMDPDLIPEGSGNRIRIGRTIAGTFEVAYVVRDWVNNQVEVYFKAPQQVLQKLLDTDEDWSLSQLDGIDTLMYSRTS